MPTLATLGTRKLSVIIIFEIPFLIFDQLFHKDKKKYICLSLEHVKRLLFFSQLILKLSLPTRKQVNIAQQKRSQARD